MKSTPKPAKLKRYYLKPQRNPDYTRWILSSGKDGIDFWDDDKKKAVKESAAFIRSHGGGTLRIMLRSGKFQEERTYPKGSDPKQSKG